MLDVDEAIIDNMSVNGLMAITFIVCSLAWSKTSWAMTLLRVSSGKLKVFIWFAIVSTNVLFACAAVIGWVSCTPIEKAWHPMVEGRCLSPQVVIVLDIVVSSKHNLSETDQRHELNPNLAFSGIMDLALAIVPWSILRALDMQPAEKFGVAIAMSMGVFAAIAAFIKASDLPELAGPDFSCMYPPYHAAIKFR